MSELFQSLTLFLLALNAVLLTIGLVIVPLLRQAFELRAKRLRSQEFNGALREVSQHRPISAEVPASQ